MTPLFGPGNETVFETMLRFFREDEWKFQQIEGKPILRMGFRGHNGGWMCLARADNEKQRMTFYSVMESNVPEAKRPPVAEFLTRANYGMIIGNFEMDFSDGEVRYKSSIDVQGGALTTGMVKTLVYINLITFDRYLPGIMKVIFTNVTPAEACAEIEK